MRLPVLHNSHIVLNVAVMAETSLGHAIAYRARKEERDRQQQQPYWKILGNVDDGLGKQHQIRTIVCANDLFALGKL